MTSVLNRSTRPAAVQRRSDISPTILRVDNSPATPRTFPPSDRIDISREVQVIKQYLEKSSDINTAVGCLETLVHVGSTFGNDCYAIQQRHVLETIAIATDVLRNHNHEFDRSLRLLVLEYLDQLRLDRLASGYASDLEFVFLIKCLRSGVTFSLGQSQPIETLVGLIFDFGAILLSHSKYSIIECVTFLEKSALDWYICWQIIQSIMLQHPDFSSVPEKMTGTLYSVLDINSALQRLGTICPPYESNHAMTSIDELTRTELLTYCTLEAAHQVLLGVTSIPRPGFLKLAEQFVASRCMPLRYKSMMVLCDLQSLSEAILRYDTLGDTTLDENQISMVLNLRGTTARHLLSVKNGAEGSSKHPLLYDSVKSRFKETTRFTNRISAAPSSELEAYSAHMAIIKLNEWVSRRQMALPERVKEFFRNNGLEGLLCPISERPMTDAIYLRCGKTVNQPALDGLIAGNIPESHCCCDEIHIDSAHKLHNIPVVSRLAIYHLRRALDVHDIVKFGDIPTLREVFSEVLEEDKVELLRTSILTKNLGLVRFLVDSGVHVDAFNDGKTPVIIAASIGSKELVNILLENGAQPDLRDSDGMSPLTQASLDNHPEVVDILFRKISCATVEAVLSAETAIPDDRREKCATALYDLWLAYRDEEDGDGNILYLQRAMELDPENHLYAEEMQMYLDEQESREISRTYATYTDEDGNLYEGFLSKGIRSGAGKLTYSEDNKHLQSFDGEWADGRKLIGLLIYRDGSQYHGDIGMGDERHGQGILYLPCGAWYEGNWVHNEMHGEHGKYCFENGDIYEGSFANDTLNGHGKLIHSNGDYYDGTWENGLKHGFGIYDLSSVGLRYEGYWMNDKKHGAGWIVYPDGSQFQGEFYDDEPVAGDTVERNDEHPSPDHRTTDAESIESTRTDHSGNSASSPDSSKRPENQDRNLKHDRNRSFIETVGRKVRIEKDPTKSGRSSVSLWD